MEPNPAQLAVISIITKTKLEAVKRRKASSVRWSLKLRLQLQSLRTLNALMYSRVMQVPPNCVAHILDYTVFSFQVSVFRRDMLFHAALRQALFKLAIENGIRNALVKRKA